MALAGGTITLADDFTVHRMGYGAMQLAGPGVFGPPRDRDEAIAVLREAVESGVDHIDTSDFYGPYVTNEIIREALHPYPSHLRIVTKVGARRGDDGSWIHREEPDELVRQVHENLERLGLETLDLVNLRLETATPNDGFIDKSISDSFSALAELQQQGLIKHLGLSGASEKHLDEALTIAPVVSIQNYYNIVTRADEDMLRRSERDGRMYASFFPLGGFTPLQSGVLDRVAASVGASPQQTALAWLLQRSPAIALIPGTSSRAHLRENLAAADLELPPEAVAELDAI
jgi:aryl-alcohol dehydrogenase-like predicted oxidoreductase